jgi:hypothetical protein
MQSTPRRPQSNKASPGGGLALVHVIEAVNTVAKQMDGDKPARQALDTYA